MERREFIKTTGALVAGMLAGSAFADTSSSGQLEGGRLVLPMNRNWLFSRSAIADARAKVFDDSKFERVVVPHANVRVPWHSFDDKDYEFVSVYRRHFKLPPEARGQQLDHLRVAAQLRNSVFDRALYPRTDEVDLLAEPTGDHGDVAIRVNAVVATCFGHLRDGNPRRGS